LDTGEFGLPARLKPRHGVEHYVVELLRAGPVQRHSRWHEPAAQAPSVAVAPPDVPRVGRRRPRRRRLPRGAGRRGTVLTAVHSHRAYLRRIPPGYRRDRWRTD